MIKLLRPPLPPEVKERLYKKKKEVERKMKDQIYERYASELAEVFQRVSQNEGLLKDFLKDILTPKEYKMLVVRWQIVKQLAKGLSQRQIADNLHVSIATITRGSRELLDKKGGFLQVLEKYYGKN